MKLETFFEKFEQFADAPGAVGKMRELVLELAVRGKLSDQLVGDCDALGWRELVVQVNAELTAPTCDTEVPFEVPQSWVWTTLDALGDTKPRNDAPDDSESSFVPMALIPANYGECALHQVRAWGEIKKGYTHFKSGDVVMAKITPCFENGKSAVMTGLAGGIGAGTTELHVFRGAGVGVLPEFVIIYLKSSGFIKRGVPRMTGSAGQKRVPSDYFARSPFPLPPLVEQKRIVAKVDELMALCDRLEAQQQEREARYAALARASLARFADAPTPSNLQYLFHPSYTITPADLRKSILTLAVQGKLVPQDPNDEPATELVAKILAEKKRLLASKMIGRDKEWLPDEELQPAFELPASWAFSTLAEIGSINPRNDAEGDLDASFVPMRLINADLREPHEHDIRKWAEIRAGFTHFAEGDVSLAKITPCFENRKSAVMRNLANGIGAGTTELHVVRPIFVEADYILVFLKSPLFVEAGIPKMSGTAGQRRVPTSYFAASPFPLPPLAEQRRIVAKVDQLMALVDRLEEQLAASRAAAANLLSGLVAELTARSAHDRHEPASLPTERAGETINHAA